MKKLSEYQRDAIWIQEYPIQYAGTRFNARMTVVRLANGALFVHSPCEIDTETREAVENLGEVACIVAPGTYHYLHVKSAQQAFPAAETWVCPGVEHKAPGLAFDWVLGDRADSKWEDDFAQVLVRGNKFIWEVAFFHKATKTLILTDLIENFTDTTEGVSWSLKLWWKAVFRMWENPKPAPEYQLGWKDKQAAAASLHRILAWDFERIIVSHGDLIEANAQQVARQAWRHPLGDA